MLKGKAELRQAEEAFQQVEKLKRYDGPLNLARVYFTEGRLDEAADALQRAAKFTDPPAPPWTLAWLSGHGQPAAGPPGRSGAELPQGARGEDARDDPPEVSISASTTKFATSSALVLFDLARQLRSESERPSARACCGTLSSSLKRRSRLDSENIAAHYNLHLLYAELGDEEKAAEHSRLHERYKADDNATDRALQLAREKYPAANHAAEAVVIYPLHRAGAPQLPAAGSADVSVNSSARHCCARVAMFKDRPDSEPPPEEDSVRRPSSARR